MRPAHEPSRTRHSGDLLRLHDDRKPGGMSALHPDRRPGSPLRRGAEHSRMATKIARARQAHFQPASRALPFQPDPNDGSRSDGQRYLRLFAHDVSPVFQCAAHQPRPKLANDTVSQKPVS